VTATATPKFRTEAEHALSGERVEKLHGPRWTRSTS